MRPESKATREVLAFLAAYLKSDAGDPVCIGSDLGNGATIAWTAPRKRAALVLAEEFRVRARSVRR